MLCQKKQHQSYCLRSDPEVMRRQKRVRSADRGVFTSDHHSFVFAALAWDTTVQKRHAMSDFVRG
eukprot:2583646-Amphidinium_carterae.1